MTGATHALSTAHPLRRDATARAYESAVATVVGRMAESPGRPLDLAEMARIASVSRFHFDRLFRAVTGLSPRRFQTALRLQAASRLLLATRRSVTDICYDVGYASLGSFVTKFTRTFGLSPAKLRELAAALDRPWSDWLRVDHAAFGNDASAPDVRGTVTAPAAFAGLIFVGLFPRPLPVTDPLACDVLTAPGAFAVGAVPRGRHHVLAVGIPWREHPLDFLLNEQTLRGSAGDAVAAPCSDVRITLRPPRVTDPPINLALPFLIVQRIVQQSAKATTGPRSAR